MLEGRGRCQTERRAKVRHSLLPILILFSAALAQAQARPCTEKAISQGNMPVAEDAFSYMPPYGKPVVGKPAIQAANEKSFSDRTNIRHSWVGEHRIVSSASGDMAYEYGTMRTSYDSKSEGHHEFEAVVLSVYKAGDGVCRKAALTMQPLEEGKH
jgi:ketosteroid isomerase-like protein